MLHKYILNTMTWFAKLAPKPYQLFVCKNILLQFPVAVVLWLTLKFMARKETYLNKVIRADGKLDHSVIKTC